MGGQSDFGKNPYATMQAGIPGYQAGYQRQVGPDGQAVASGMPAGAPGMAANMGGMMGAPQAQSFGDAMRARMGGQFDSGMYGGNVAADPAMGQAAMAGAAGQRVTPDMIAAHRAAAMAGAAPGGMMAGRPMGPPGNPLMSPMQAALPGMRRGQEMYGMRGPVTGRPGYGR